MPVGRENDLAAIAIVISIRAAAIGAMLLVLIVVAVAILDLTGGLNDRSQSGQK